MLRNVWQIRTIRNMETSGARNIAPLALTIGLQSLQEDANER
jgi:hypothetical protein